MIDINISLEATCDLDDKTIKENNLKIIDMNFMVDGNEYSTKDNNVVSVKLYQKMREGKKTSTSLI